MTQHAAVDLGASSGRVVVAEVAPGELSLREVHRFANEPHQSADGLHWDIDRLHTEVLAGLRKAAGAATVGVDSWAIDYGLLDASGELIDAPFHYRDDRTVGVAERLHTVISAQALYALHGLQEMPFTTLYQLAADTRLDNAVRLLLIPDLLGYWLTGVGVAELTNASTTGLLDVRTRQWSQPVLSALAVSDALLPPLVPPGEQIGRLLPAVGLDATLVAVGSHDTASAVVGVPMAGDDAAYISLGTWALVGVELEAPVLSEASRLANFTNELGVDGRIRYLRNVMGLWLLQECLRVWDQPDLEPLLHHAASLPLGGPTFDVNDPCLLAPGDMPSRINDLLGEAGSRCTEPHQLVRAIIDSLALALAQTVHEAATLSGRPVNVVHVVGGGSQSELLCQLLADAVGLPVLAGPVEATAIGNLLVQARAHGTLTGDLEALRHLVRTTQQVRRHDPQR